MTPFAPGKQKPRATVLSDTRCAHCGKRKRLPTTKWLPRFVYEADKYCSRKCCEEAQT